MLTQSNSQASFAAEPQASATMRRWGDSLVLAVGDWRLHPRFLLTCSVGMFSRSSSNARWLSLFPTVGTSYWFWVSLGLLIMCAIPPLPVGAIQAPAPRSGSHPGLDRQSSLQALCDRERVARGWPALFLAVQRGDQPLFVAASGVRRFGNPTPVTPQDLVHIGSCTKAVTGYLLGRLVDRGILKWESTIVDVFPELRDGLAPEYRSVTLLQLLQHRGGVAENPENWFAHSDRQEIQATRLAILQEALATCPADHRVGSFHYSNLGYMVAGAMAERVTGEAWEALMRREVFEPLGITSAGFGVPGTLGRTEQPWGHFPRSDESAQRDPGSDGDSAPAAAGFHSVQIDNAPALGPAGTLHWTLADWSRFTRIFYRPGADTGLQPETLEQLLKPEGSERYSAGWLVPRITQGVPAVLTHAGSNTTWTAEVWVDRSSQTTYWIVTNFHSPEVLESFPEILTRLRDWERSSVPEVGRH